MRVRKIEEDLDCGINVAMKVFGAKWKPCIIDTISRGSVRPSQIHKQISGATPRVIDMQLRELEEYGVVEKQVFGGFPLKTEYSLTSLGKSILPIIKSMDIWGIMHMNHVKEVNNSKNYTAVAQAFGH